MNRIYLSTNRIILFLLCSAYTYIFYWLPDLPWTLSVMVLAATVGVLLVYLLLNLDILLMRCYRLVNALALVYCLSALISLFFNDLLTPYAGLSVLQLLIVLPFLEIQREKEHMRFLYWVMLIWFGILLFANDVLMVIMPGRFYGDGIDKTFLLGNKFSVGYDHIILLLMFCLLFGQNKKIRMLLPFLFAAVCVVCKYIDCNTSVLGTAVFFLIAFAPDSVREVLGRKRFALIVIIICALFVFFDSLVQIPAIKYFITEVLGRDVTLTGRAQIYKVIPKVIRGSPWLGYGTSSEVIYRYTGAYNAQNGFFDLAVQNGIPSAVLYVLLILALIRKGESGEAAFVLGATYGYFVMSTVEMTYGSTLMLFGILLFTDSDAYRDEPVTIIEWRGQVP